MLNIVALQTATVAGNLEANYERTSSQIRALSPRPDLVLLPELSGPGYDNYVLKNKEKFAEDAHSGLSFHFYSQLANETNITIAYGILRKHRDSDAISIAHVVVKPDTSVLAVYDKIHLCQVGKCSEVSYGIVPGYPKPCVFELAGMRVGLCICYDLRFAELWRAMAWSCHADVVLHPCAFVRDTTFHTWHQFVTTRALENGVFVVSLSHAGEQYGESIACPPWVGDITRIKDNAEYTEQLEVSIVAGTAEGALNVSVDLALLDDVRRIIPFQKVSRCIVLS